MTSTDPIAEPVNSYVSSSFPGSSFSSNTSPQPVTYLELEVGILSQTNIFVFFILNPSPFLFVMSTFVNSASASNLSAIQGWLSPPPVEHQESLLFLCFSLSRQ